MFLHFSEKTAFWMALILLFGAIPGYMGIFTLIHNLIVNWPAVEYDSYFLSLVTMIAQFAFWPLFLVLIWTIFKVQIRKEQLEEMKQAFEERIAEVDEVTMGKIDQWRLVKDLNTKEESPQMEWKQEKQLIELNNMFAQACNKLESEARGLEKTEPVFWKKFMNSPWQKHEGLKYMGFKLGKPNANNQTAVKVWQEIQKKFLQPA